jgi:DNA-binding GntR family transcriptional regulator
MFLERLRYLGGQPLSLDLTYLVPDTGDLVTPAHWKLVTFLR